MGGEAVILFIKLTKNGHFPGDFSERKCMLLSILRILDGFV